MDLCSCHKSREKDADDDDMPYSPKKSTVFFGSRKNTVTDKTLTSTPNQLINIRKLNENDLLDNMDVRNNNQYSGSVNDASLTSSHLNDLPNSPIEKDSTKCINLDSNDQLNQIMDYRRFGSDDHSNDQRTPTFPTANSRSAYEQQKEINSLTDQFSSPWLKPDEQRCDSNISKSATPINKLSRNSSSSNLPSSNHPNADLHHSFSRNRSESNLSSLESANGDKLAKSSDHNSLIDIPDNIIPVSNSTNHLDKFNYMPAKGSYLTDVAMNNILNQLGNLNDPNKTNKQARRFPARGQTSEPPDRRPTKEDLNANAITSLINLPSHSESLKRVSSDDKISLDNSSIESVVIDRLSNEIVRKSNHSNEHDQHLLANAIKHPNSLIIQETVTVTLKRDENEKKSLNEFSMTNLPRHMLENSSLMKEYFYDEPVIKTNSRFFEEDLATYRMQSDPRGLCLIINNATTKQDCLRLKNGFIKELKYFTDLYDQLGFTVETHSNVNARDILKLMKRVKSQTNFEAHDAFVCIFLGHGNQNYVIGEDNFKLNLELMIGYMNNYHCPALIKKPKIFIVHTCNSTCQQFLEPIAPSNIPREVQALKKISDFKIIPTWTDTVIIYSPFLNTNLYYSAFVKEFGLLICSNACDKPLHDILLQVRFAFYFIFLSTFFCNLHLPLLSQFFRP